MLFLYPELCHASDGLYTLPKRVYAVVDIPGTAQHKTFRQGLVHGAEKVDKGVFDRLVCCFL